MLELWVHDTITGDEIARVFPIADTATWSTNIGGTGQSTFAFRVDDPDAGMRRSRVASLFRPIARSFALRSGGYVIGAWKIEDWNYSDDDKTVTVTAVELVRSEAKWRMTYPLSDYAAGTLTVTNRSYPGAVRAILQRFMQWSPEWNYPIDLPPDGVGSFTQTWEFWKKLTIADLLAQIEAEGVEVFFRPYLDGRQLRYQTLVASRVSAGSSGFHLQAEDSPLSGVRYRVSGAEQITGGQGLGAGTGQDQAVKYDGGPPFTIPIRDAKHTFPDLNGDRLQSATSKWFEQASEPIVQWTVEKFTTSEAFRPHLAVTGRAWNLQSQGHPIFPDGIHQLRVISASGTFGADITTEVQSV